MPSSLQSSSSSLSTKPWTLWAAPWSRPLAAALTVGAVRHTTRAGLLIAVEHDGRCGIADAAPLPGLSHETIDDVIAGLHHCAGLSWSTLQDPHELELHLPHLPSLAWALCAAIREAGESSSRPAVRSAVLVDDAAAFATANTMPVDAVVKLKVGRDPLAHDVARIGGWRQQHPTARLRLDGNRRLSPAAAVVLAEVAGPALAFFEEPTALEHQAGLPAWVPLGLDETLDDDGAREVAMAGEHRAVAWVLKPTVLGPWRTAALISRARALGVETVVSSAFDSSVGRRSLVRLGSSAAPTVVHGLGTWRSMQQDLVMRDGAIVVEVDGHAAVGAPLQRADLVGVSFERVP